MIELRNSLACLAKKTPVYGEKLRQSQFQCSHVNDDWIAAYCPAAVSSQHQRYLVEYAAEVLVTTKPTSILHGDAYVCQSEWLQQLKSERLANYGPVESLDSHPRTAHLAELSLGLQEFMRLRNNLGDSVDRAKVQGQLQEFARRRTAELEDHRADIARIQSGVANWSSQDALQAFLSKEFTSSLGQFAPQEVQTLDRNQLLRRDEQISVATFGVTDNCLFVVWPIAILSTDLPTGQCCGSLSSGFRLMTPAALSAPKFEFGRDTVLHLDALLPNSFSGYRHFEGPENFCLNVLAWTAALHLLVPDVLKTLRAAAARSSLIRN